jgi:hypothetical protein
MSYRNFESDLKIGLGLESEITNRLSQVTEVENSQEYNPDFDIVLTQLVITLEVKLDEASNRYQNYCIETRYEGQPSGINSTKADVWIQGNNDGLLILNRLALLELVSDMKTIRRDIQGKDVEMCLVPKNALIMHGTVVKPEDNQNTYDPSKLLYAIIKECQNN